MNPPDEFVSLNFIKPSGTPAATARLNRQGGPPLHGGLSSRIGQGQQLERKAPMGQLTRDDVIRAVGRADDVTIAEVIGTGATADELAEAQAWLVNDEPLLNARKPPGGGRACELIHI